MYNLKELTLMDENGKRSDGRGIDELRSIKITVGVVKNADGSAYKHIGKNKIIVAVYGPREVSSKTYGSSRQVCS